MASTLFIFLLGVLVVVSVSKKIYLGLNIPGITLPLAPGHRLILERYFEYYLKLPPKSKKIFEKKVSAFIQTKKFIPRELEIISDEMKVLVAATAVQLTFGLPGVTLKFFKYIVVYPYKFFNEGSQKYHFGEVNPKYKAIALSWENFVSSLIVKDGRNLGLHEMAHALRLENQIVNGEHGFLDKKVLHDWEQMAQLEMTRIKESEVHFFRNYAGSNKEEFFAVAVENFFEKPKEFAAFSKELYYLLCKLLNQDPLLLNK